MVDELVVLKMLPGCNKQFVRAGMVYLGMYHIYPKLDSGAAGRIFPLWPVE
jgi:hypothetical protein